MSQKVQLLANQLIFFSFSFKCGFTEAQIFQGQIMSLFCVWSWIHYFRTTWRSPCIIMGNFMFYMKHSDVQVEVIEAALVGCSLDIILLVKACIKPLVNSHNTSICQLTVPVPGQIAGQTHLLLMQNHQLTTLHVFILWEEAHKENSQSQGEHSSSTKKCPSQPADLRCQC